jgi:hypothetical protein
VTILKRDADQFQGIYNADNGDYEWRIEGTIKDEKVDWRFTETIHEKDPKRVAGVATVSGTFKEDGYLEGRFQGKDSRADLTLRVRRRP